MLAVSALRRTFLHASGPMKSRASIRAIPSIPCSSPIRSLSDRRMGVRHGGRTMASRRPEDGVALPHSDRGRSGLSLPFQASSTTAIVARRKSSARTGRRSTPRSTPARWHYSPRGGYLAGDRAARAAPWHSRRSGRSRNLRRRLDGRHARLPQSDWRRSSLREQRQVAGGDAREPALGRAHVGGGAARPKPDEARATSTTSASSSRTERGHAAFQDRCTHRGGLALGWRPDLRRRPVSVAWLAVRCRDRGGQVRPREKIETYDIEPRTCRSGSVKAQVTRLTWQCPLQSVLPQPG